MNKQNSAQEPEQSHKKTLIIAVIFSIVFVIIVIIALVIKTAILFSQSTFDGQHQFLLLVQGNHQAEIMAFSPDTQSIAELKIAGIDNASEIEKAVLVPYEAQVRDLGNNNNETIVKFLWKMMLGFPSFSPKHINLADVYKLWNFAKKVNQGSITMQEIHLPLKDNAKVQLQQNFFTDHTLFQEAETITIVNATGISGKGNQVAAMLTNIGANVIVVNTADSQEKQSHIYYRSSQIAQSYTIKRLHKLLSFPIASYSQPYSDIMIVIGKDNKQIIQ